MPIQYRRTGGHNVAYWNLHEWTISVMGRVRFAAEVPLWFLYLGEGNGDSPEVLTKHTRGDPRVTPNGRPELKEPGDEYRRLLAEAGHEKWKSRCIAMPTCRADSRSLHYFRQYTGSSRRR